ncbi:MAG: tRNA 2-thiouridine(34) synthase MnmA [bacterium]|nr:tRNA 2-thiouridine(34) synthase MnmA [bacterium]
MARILNKHKINTPLKIKVLVLMSGGVDSSVAAALLQKQGYDITGVYLKLYQAPKKNNKNAGLGDLCWINEKRDAQKVAAKLGIPFFVLDVTREYKKRVMDYFFKEYAAGRTPNPDVMCNKEIKFGFALNKALKLGYDFVATGHYARKSLLHPPLSKGKRGEFLLLAARDKNKDQSYFLWTLTQAQLARILFPVGDYTKPQARQLAKKFGLPTWNKKDSQGICFLGKVKVADFLQRKIKPRKGDIIDLQGRKIGEHQGVWFYTIGQRQGLNIGGSGPYYVYQKNVIKNQLIVASRKDERKLNKRETRITNLYWIALPPKQGENIMARSRYRAPLVKVKLKKTKQKNVWQVCFFKPVRALTSGQSIVFYKDGQCLGGAIIQ